MWREILYTNYVWERREEYSVEYYMTMREEEMTSMISIV